MTDQICYILLTNVFPDQMCSSVMVLVEENPFLDAYTFRLVNRFFTYRNWQTPPCTADGYWWFCASEATPLLLNTGSRFRSCSCKKLYMKQEMIIVCRRRVPMHGRTTLNNGVSSLFCSIVRMCVFAGIIMIFDGTLCVCSGIWSTFGRRLVWIWYAQFVYFFFKVCLLLFSIKHMIIISLLGKCFFCCSFLLFVSNSRFSFDLCGSFWWEQWLEFGWQLCLFTFINWEELESCWVESCDCW